MPDAEPDRTAVIITIDGPAGTGKSTVAHGLASRLGLDFLDTGAMYRAAALLALRRSIPPDDGVALAAALESSRLRFDWSADPPRMMLGDEDVGEAIRDQAVTAIVSVVAAQTPVREVMVRHQRRIAREHPRLVSEGRDQGSVVFPDAAIRFYLDADVEVRAERRARQLIASGTTVNASQLVDEIRRRDELDTTRRAGPLVRPAGAIDIDTGLRSADAVVALMEVVARERLPDAGFTT
jgi:cytidylate kinase